MLETKESDESCTCDGNCKCDRGMSEEMKEIFASVARKLYQYVEAKENLKGHIEMMGKEKIVKSLYMIMDSCLIDVCREFTNGERNFKESHH